MAISDNEIYPGIFKYLLDNDGDNINSVNTFTFNRQAGTPPGTFPAINCYKRNNNGCCPLLQGLREQQ